MDFKGWNGTQRQSNVERVGDDRKAISRPKMIGDLRCGRPGIDDGFVVLGGFIEDPTGVAALYLGKQEGKELRYMGKVGTGWSRTKSAEIRKALDTVVSPKTKLSKPIRKPIATWVEPKFFAEVEYRDITSEGLLRTSSFKGLTRK